MSVVEYVLDFIDCAKFMFIFVNYTTKRSVSGKWFSVAIKFKKYIYTSF